LILQLVNGPAGFGCAEPWELFLRHSKRFGKGRGTRPGRSSTDLFEAALFGKTESDRPRFDAGSDRKTLQLCRQVERAISLALSGHSDDLLRDLSVDGVEPMGSAGHLLVRVIVAADVSVIDVMARLDAASARLRAEVAASICRKRVPALSFIPIAGGAS
jgi:hypothetical protein